MKKFNYISCIICSVMLLFASCSKDDPAAPIEEENVATLSFGAVLNDLMNDKQGMKQAFDDFPSCTDATPSYVAVVLSGTTAVGTMEDPLVIPLNPTPGDFDNDGEDEYFTVESPDLELEPGPYSLDFFAVYDSGDNLIWLAPTNGGDFAGYVNALPMDFNLGAGVKKYLNVDVLCFDNRFVNLYGYLFFELDATEVIELCLFGNVCDDDGRHAPANFRFDVWTYSGNPANPYGMPLFNENNPFINNVGVNSDGDAFADPLCVFLPDSGGEDVYYGELYLLENGTSTMIRSGEFTDEDVRDLFDGDDTVDYYHFREGNCNMDDSPQLLEIAEEEEPAPEITEDTNIYIYADSSGSMTTTQIYLENIYNSLLKDLLISHYNNDEALYEEKVRLILDPSERTFDFLNLQGENPDGNVIVMVFQAEAEPVYNSGAHWDENIPRTEIFDQDITALRERLKTTNTRYDGIIFHVENFNPHDSHDEAVKAFRRQINYIEHGTGNYSGSYGLADRSEITYVYGVREGYGYYSWYYVDLIQNSLESLGYGPLSF